MRRSSIFFISLFCFSLLGCEIINPEEEIPSYIRISSVTLKTNKATQGFNTHKIKDTWIYIENEIQGIYELPVEFPVLNEGNIEVLAGAGILFNGIAATRGQYPFYRIASLNTTLVRGEIVEISPEFEYFSGLNFKWIEGFEDAGFTLEKTSRSDTNMFKISKPDPNVIYDDNCGGIFMDEDHFLTEFESTTDYILPKGGADVFLELDYKNNHPFVIGVTTIEGSTEVQQSLITLTAKDDWNKIYVDLTPTVSSAVSADKYRIFFRIIRDEGYPAPIVYLDNIKLVHE